MLKQIVNRFPGISCAYVDATGKVTTEYYGVSDKEKNIIMNTYVYPCSNGYVMVDTGYEHSLKAVEAKLNRKMICVNI